MDAFICKDFLLDTETARNLYHETAAKLPIIDYHCHIPAAEIAGDIKFENITQAWLYGDHYKWRAMRACGVDERLITGDASDEEKFRAFAGCMPHLIGNPLYHWSHLELKRYFGIEIALSDKTAGEVWEKANTALYLLSARTIMERSNVKAICTTDDPADTLEHHRIIAEDKTFNIKVLPAFRPDLALGTEKPGYADYIKKLGTAAGVTIESFSDLTAALSKRMDVFDSLVCRACDHGLLAFPMVGKGLPDADAALQKRLAGGVLTNTEENALRGELLLFLGREYAKRSWVMEIHFGVLRNTNRRMFDRLGADSGFDNMSAADSIPALTAFLDTLCAEGNMPKVLLFSINPTDNAPLCTLCGAFGNNVQQGSAWWFNDTLNGMREQITTYASLLPLGKFIGFLTDSRSFLSYTRHEYFRRILCGWIGRKVENGEFTNEPEALEALVRGVCYENAKAFLALR